MDRDGDPLLRDAKLVFAEQSARGGHRSLEDVRQAWKLAIGVSTTAPPPHNQVPHRVGVESRRRSLSRRSARELLECELMARHHRAGLLGITAARHSRRVLRSRREAHRGTPRVTSHSTRITGLRPLALTRVRVHILGRESRTEFSRRLFLVIMITFADLFYHRDFSINT